MTSFFIMLSSSNVLVRLAKRNDFPFVADCLKDLVRICNLSNKKPREIPHLEQTFLSVINDQKTHPLFIAEYKGKPAGMASCNLLKALDLGCTSLQISCLVVSNQIRGSGAGSALIKHIKKYAKQHDIQSLELVTPPVGSEHEKDRYKFYMKHGFSQLGPGFYLTLNE